MEYGVQMSLLDGSKQFKISKPIRLVELFGGIGAQSKALERLGVKFEHYRLCEIDKYAVTSYNAIHGTNFKPSDITKIHADDLGIVDTDKYCYIMTYSFPCQDLSLAGKQRGMGKGTGTRSGLLWEVERLLFEMKELPQVLLMENVPEVIGQKNIKHFAEWIKTLDELGYKSKWQLLNAKDFGVPQNRNRCFMVSILGDYYYDFPQGKPLTKRLKDLLEKKVSEKYYLSNRTIKMFVEHTAKKQDEMVDDIKCKQIWQIDGMFESTGRVYSAAGLCPTINTMGGGDREPKIIADTNYDRIRKLTPLECWRLMNFDDEDFKKAKAAGISDSQLYRQAGNSIVVAVLEAIFKQML